jgi:hypothetical protein
MDPLPPSKEILDNKRWLFFKLYKDPDSERSWQNNLNWYHQILIQIVRPIVDAHDDIRAVFFGIYGQDHYDNEDEEYEKQINPQAQTNWVFVRLRMAVELKNKDTIKNEFMSAILNNKKLIWDYEVMNTFNVMRDLGSRYGSNNEDQTLGFVRYWDAGCRYILSIVTMPGNWMADVDVWGIPHLINNSIGAWLRQKPPQSCPNCGNQMYINITGATIRLGADTDVGVPLLVLVCPHCQTIASLSTNM